MPEPKLNVTVAEISLDGGPSKYEVPADTDPLAVWADYMITNRYEKDPHRYMLGTGTPGGAVSPGLPSGTQDTVAFVQLARPTLLWICRWTAARWQTKPDIPDPGVGDEWILLDDHTEPAMVVLNPNGQTPLYRISGTYFYGHRNPSDAIIDDANYPRPPWIKEDAFERTLSTADFNAGLTDIEEDFPDRPGDVVIP